MTTHEIIKYPLSTEKAIRMMESANKLLFIVDLQATKTEIKQAVEDAFKAKVIQVHTCKDMKGRKRAYVQFSKEHPAIDIATQLGLM